MMKKILKSIFVCIIMITTLLTGVNYIKADDSEATYDGIKYKINTAEKWATVSGYTGTDKDVTIPNMIGRGIIVSEIEDHAFDSCSTIRVLTIPDTIMKVGDMSFIGMDNLQAIISRTEGINIVVKENVQIVSDRSELGDIEMDGNNTSGNNSKGDSDNTSGSSDNNSGNNRIEDAKSVDGGGIIIGSNNGIITDSSNGNIQIGSNVDSESSDSAKNEISDGNGVISDNKTNNNTAEKSDNNKNEAGTSQSNKSSTTKVVVIIICIILVAGLAAGLFIYMKKKKR